MSFRICNEFENQNDIEERKCICQIKFEEDQKKENNENIKFKCECIKNQNFFNISFLKNNNEDYF